MKFVKLLLKILFPVAVLSGAGFAAWYMVINRPVPAKENISEPEIPVQVISAERGDYEVVIEGSGEVRPAKQIMLQAQVSGEVIDIHPNLIPGGIFQKGEVLLRIDPRDFQYIVDQLNERVELAQMRLEEEEGRQTVAKREWELLGKELETTKAGRSLALREPHIRSAKAALKSAHSALKDAKLDLERTEITAPFNCWVLNENVDVGQVVNPQTQIATLVGTDKYWVDTKIESEDLPYVFVPGLNGDESSEVEVIYDAGPLRYEYTGTTVRLLGDMSNAGRMVRVLIEVEDPLGMKKNHNEENVPMFLNSFVNTHIKGKTLQDVFLIPRVAIREGNRVWIRNQEGRLEIQEVEIIRKRKEDVLVSSGMKEGQQIVTSILATPLPGIKLAVEESEESGLGSVEVVDAN